ncbi:MAG: BlaI/MecI/CopY family transcriptional regulator [Pirellulales bacterium]|nr:BlaI/MecI/CopY family transcriptional regulator [Planctomycetales bacterium]
MMAKDRPPLAKSELEVARIVWQLGEATVRQVHEALPDDRDLDFWTVQTYLRRLREKGYLTATRRGQGNVYAPAVKPGKVIGELTDDFLDRLFDGEALPLVQHLIDAHRLSADDIELLQRRLEELKGGEK